MTLTDRYHPWATILATTLLLVTSLGCQQPLPRFSEPAPNEPHALVTVEIAYATRPGPKVKDTVAWNSMSLRVPEANRTDQGATSVLRMPAGGGQWQFSTAFYHMETTSDYEYVTRYKNGKEILERERVTHIVQVFDGACKQVGRYLLDRANSYTLRFTFLAAGRCELSCRHQLSTSSSEACQSLPNLLDADVARAVAESRRSADTVWEIDGRVGYGIATDYGAEGAAMTQIVSGQVPFVIGAGLRLVPSVMLGAYLQVGVGRAGSSLKGSCSTLDHCSVIGAAAGAQVIVHARPDHLLDPWFGLGIGYESLVVMVERGAVKETLRFSGLEFRGQAGVDVRVSRSVRIGPFGSLTVSRYRDLEVEDSGAAAVSSTIDAPPPHGWLVFGMRSSLVF